VEVHTFNQQLFDALVRHQIGLLQFSGGVRNKVWALLDATEAQLRAQINDGLRGAAGEALTPKRLRQIEQTLRALRETRIKAWDQVDEVWFEEMQSLALAEPGFVAGAMDSIFPVDLGLEMPDPMRLKAIVESRPFMGQTLEGWAKKIRSDDIARIEQQIRIGMVQGEDIPSISRRIVGSLKLKGTDGVTAVTRRQAESITRTATNAVAAESRRELYLDNADLMDGELFVATLDSKTTPICRALDGKIYPVGEAPRLPLHWGERSAIAPVVDGEVIGERPFRAFTDQQLLREFAEQEGLDKVPKTRKGLPHGTKGAYDEFARKRMRELTGTVPAKTSYQEWLSTQSAQFQDDILGPTRGALFREGGLTLEKFVAEDGSELTLEQLAQREKAAFEAAGVDTTTLRPINGGPSMAAIESGIGESDFQTVERLRKEEIARTLDEIALNESRKNKVGKQKFKQIDDELNDKLQKLLAGELDEQLAATAGIKLGGPPPPAAPAPQVATAATKKAAKKKGAKSPDEMNGEELLEYIENQYREDFDEYGALMAEQESRQKAWEKFVKETDSAPTDHPLYLALHDAGQAVIDKSAELRNLMINALEVKDGIELSYTAGVKLKAELDEKVQRAMKFLSKVVSKSSDPKRFAAGMAFEYRRFKGRAYARPWANSVHLADSDLARTVVHEIGHLIEAGNLHITDSRYLSKVRAFLKERLKHDPVGVQKLSKLTKIRSYAADEVAFKDEFINPYMGKIYGELSSMGSSEVISMGLELLFADPVQFMRKDPEMFAWLVDVIRGIE
jgi:SPP1 gp7 family putative phage head morphogenesis protein